MEFADKSFARLRAESLRQLLDAMPCAAIVKDREGRVLFLNRMWRERMTALGTQVGKTPHETYPRELAELLTQQDESVFATGATTIEALGPCPTDERQFLVRRVAVRGTELGDVEVGICEEITQMRDAERELRRERSIIEAVLFHADALLILVDSEGRVLRFNRACEEASGYKAEEVIGKYYPSLFQSPADAQTRIAGLGRMMAAKGSLAFEAPWLAARGEPRTISWTLTPLKDSQGNIEHVVGTGLDVTYQRQIEQALRESEQQFRLLWERSNDGMRILDGEGLTVVVNEAYARMVGRRQDELIGRPFWEMYGGATGEAMRANWDAWMQTDPRSYRGEQAVRKPDGAEVWLDLLISPIELPGRSRLILSIARDITPSKRQAVEIAAARAVAEAASAAKSQFLANISHELRTPMNAILGLTSLVLESPLDAAQHAYLETVRESAVNLLSMLNDLLDFSKTDAGMMRLDPVPFALQSMLDGVMRTSQTRTNGAQVEVALEIGEGVPPEVIGDALRLRQVLLNLLGNAIKFTERGWVRLRVDKIGMQRPGAVQIRFAVIDTGIGIPADKQTVIFDAFTQADGSTTRQYGGTGLGLSISSQLVQLMGGRLECVSEVGVGSEFSFEALLGVPERRQTDDGAKRPFRVLVAEDNLANRTLLTGLLERDGHSVSAVASGRQAIERAENEHFDLLLMDVQMPEMDGIAAAVAIREMEKRLGRVAAVYLAAITADTSAESRTRCEESGMNGFLSKPIVRGELERVVQAAAAQASPRGHGQIEIDLEAALGRVGGDLELLREVAQLFLGDYPNNIAEIRQAITEQNANALERGAHTLKGAVANFGAATTVAAAFALEKIGRSGDLTTAQSTLLNLEAALAALVPELESI